MAEAKQKLQRLLAEAGAASEAQALVDVGAPIDCILRRVRETKADLLVLGVFKYYGFFATDVDRLLGGVGLGLPLPLLTIV